MKQIELLLILVLTSILTQALVLSATNNRAEGGDAIAINSGSINSSVAPGAQFAIENLSQFASENPLDQKRGRITNEIISGKNASVNLTQLAPGSRFGLHYHNATDEIAYIIQGQGNLSLNSKDYPVKAGDLVYIPPHTIHDYTNVGNKTLQILVIFAPQLNGDRTYV